MASTLSGYEKIALNHNNAANLKALHEINSSLFQDYAPKGGVLTEWFDGEEQVRDGLGVLYDIGLPYAIWRLFIVSIDEFALLKTYVGNVTLRTFNKTTGAYTNYNAVMELPIKERKWDEAHDQWAEVGVSFYDLEAI